MKLLIDNLDGHGAQDYTGFIDASQGLSVVRKLNSPAALKVSLFGVEGSFTVPACGARIVLTRNNGADLVTGYVASTPSYEYVGWAEPGAQYRYRVEALSDVVALDQKTPSPKPPFVARSAGDALRQLTQDAMPGGFDLSGVEAGDTIPYFSLDPAKAWTSTAAEIARAARGSFRDDNAKLLFSALAQNSYPLAESDTAFSPGGLELRSVNRLVNDLTIVGQTEPSAHVKDYFIGDGYTTTFYLSQIPFTRSSQIPQYSRTILDEEYAEIDPARWAVADPRNAISVSGGQLQVAGGTGTDGQTCLEFVEKIELGGATVLQHGDVAFNAASDGVIGGLYSGEVSIAGCLAGFRVTPSGANSSIQALVNGAVVGAPLATQPGHHYLFTTRLYPSEIYRMQQVYHSALHPSGNARGGNVIASDVRVVLEVHDIDPANPATQVAPATVLHDDVIGNAPGYCVYALINAASMRCSVAFTYIFLAIDALVRSALPGQNARTRRTGSLREGAECHVSNSPTLQFYPEYAPAANETIEVTYRSSGSAMGRVMNSASIMGHQNGTDDGVRAAVRHVAAPAARTSVDCEMAALALLDDAGQGWSGAYETWDHLLPGGATDIFPGDGLAVDVPSRNASFPAIVREVECTVLDIAEEHVRYVLRFVDAGDPSLAFAFATAEMQFAKTLTPIDVSQAGLGYLTDLAAAEITAVSSTTITVDTGLSPPPGSGIEVRYTDTAWGTANSRNLIGRYQSNSFVLPRYARVQTYFLRSYDSSSPAKYSRYSAALHIDYPL